MFFTEFSVRVGDVGRYPKCLLSKPYPMSVWTREKSVSGLPGVGSRTLTLVLAKPELIGAESLFPEAGYLDVLIEAGFRENVIA
jgi:hypothetical protein